MNDASIQHTLSQLPDMPGVYLFYTKNTVLIYVGKATSLKSRVRSYFSPRKTASRPIESLLHEVASISYETTASVLEAIILESAYIKKYQPKYNVIGKDNKSWNYLLITKEVFPTLVALRQHSFAQLTEREIQEKYLYVFGPFPGLNTREALKILRRIFLFSVCQRIKNKDTQRTRTNQLPNKQSIKSTQSPCLYRQMGQCLGVCTGEIDSRSYHHAVVRPLALFLSGKKKSVITHFEEDMRRAAKKEDFETATRLRDQLRALSRIQDVALINASFMQEAFADDSVKYIQRVEGYDISHFGGKDIVGSMVVFDSAGPVKSAYRRFALRGMHDQNDTAALGQVLERRLKHDEWSLPDIFLIDGGVLQVQMAVRMLEQAQVRRPVVGIGKGPERKRNDLLIRFPFASAQTRQAPWLTVEEQRHIIACVAAVRPLLLRVRDEAHRFAVSYQRKKRHI